MKLSLLHNAKLEYQEGPAYKWISPLNPNIFQKLREDYPEFEYLIGPMENLMIQRIGHQGSRYLSVRLNREGDETLPHFDSFYVQLYGNVMSELNAIFREGTGLPPTEHMRLVLLIENPVNGSSIEINNFKPLAYLTHRGFYTDHKNYSKSYVRIPKFIFSDIGVQVDVTLEVNFDSRQRIDTGLPISPDDNGKLFHDKSIPRDVEIITMEGIRVPCHWIHLASHSSIFRTMLTFSIELDSDKCYELELRGMSEKGVNALLKYIYMSSLTDAEEDPKIAMELLDAADLYKISSLFNAMQEFFMNKSETWMGLEVAVKLHRLSRNLTDLNALFDRVDHYLRSREPELKEYLDNNEDLFGKEYCKQLLSKLFGPQPKEEPVTMKLEKEESENSDNSSNVTLPC